MPRSPWRDGVDVIGTYRRDREAAESMIVGVQAAGARATVLALDLAESDPYADFAERVGRVARDEFGRDTIDFLVNNAGIGVFAPFAQTTTDQFDAQVHVNVRGPFFVTQALAHLLPAGGRVLNVSTAVVRGVVPGLSAYAASKGGVEVLTRYLAVELAERGIRVNTVVGGAVDTEFGDGMMQSDVARESALETIALGRVAVPDDITAAIPHILSDGFGWATGATIDVSGGQSL